MKKILGLDLGVTSIGWALISEQDDKNEILGMGSRIIPLSVDDKNEFSSGKSISKNQNRTTKRSQRKIFDRYQLRRKYLIDILKQNGMLPNLKLIQLDKLGLWSLRSKAASEEISLMEFGRILLLLNQKRGYKSARIDANMDKKDTDYVKEVKTRHERLISTGYTIGQYFYSELKENPAFEIKKKVYPREAYVEEFTKICKAQQKFHFEITDDFITHLRDEIIYYQRKLKSQKGLISICEFEGFFVHVKDNSDNKFFVGPRVSPKSSPLFQVCKIWESVNNITLQNRKGEQFSIERDKKIKIFEYLNNNERLSLPELYRILELKKEDGWSGNKYLAKGLQGNLTKFSIRNCFDNTAEVESLFKFETPIINLRKEVYLVDKKTGELSGSNNKKIINPEIENEPLYKLWHVIYSIHDKEECKRVLINNFNIPVKNAEKLASIDFTKQAYGNKSVKAMRKILPYLMEGYVYSDACELAGYNHSNSLTKEENLQRELLDKLPNLPKNSLRQPIVEKILNQMINVVNSIISKYGAPDEIRVELARELKQSREERNNTFLYNSKRERENTVIANRIKNEYGLKATHNTIIKWRLYHEINGDDNKTNACCIYCGQPFGITAALSGHEVDIEHIIPKKRIFDDSQSNKTLSHRKCNSDKKDLTAYDFMKTKTDAEFEAYLARVDQLYKNHIISKTKKDKLLMSIDKIPQDFIDRQLRQTQYISRKSREILQQVCHNVWATSGAVTEYLRRIWGWHEVLMNLQLPLYRDLNLTEMIEFEKDGQLHKKEVISNWSKRDDHRHHAIDALTIACSKQGYIQRMNTLNADSTKNSMFEDIQGKFDQKKNLLENYIFNQKPFTTAQVMEAASKIIVSFKPGKKVATFGVRKVIRNGKKTIVQSGIIVPRGALSEENIYGKIKRLEANKPVKYLLENPQTIVKQNIKNLILERLNRFDTDTKKAIASLKKEPIYLNNEKTIELAFGSCYQEEIVTKYPITSINAKDLESIVDKSIREIIKKRLTQYGNKEKEAFRNLEENPVWFNEEKRIPIKTVRCYTGLTSVVSVKKDESGKDIGFVKPGNNHHIVIYKDENGNKQEQVVTFWQAVERKKHGLPVIIKDTNTIWNKILENPDCYPDTLKEALPLEGWGFEISLQQNEMFILGLPKEEAEKAISDKNYKYICSYLYRVQKVASKDYSFRLHLETQISDCLESKLAKRFYRINSLSALEALNPVKVSINNLGDII
jgi:CRISPR-associated endonuclease Csn1